MMDNFCGPRTKELNITIHDLCRDVSIDPSVITNGLILEIDTYSRTTKSAQLTSTYVHKLFKISDTDFNTACTQQLQVKILRLKTKCDKLRRNKKHGDLSVALNDIFMLPSIYSDHKTIDNAAVNVSLAEPVYNSNTDNVNTSITVSGKGDSVSMRPTINSSSDIEYKQHIIEENQLQHNISTKQFTYNKLLSDIETKKAELQNIQTEINSLKGHYAKRNVDKRDERHVVIRDNLQKQFDSAVGQGNALVELNVEKQNQLEKVEKQFETEKKQKIKEQKLKCYYKKKQLPDKISNPGTSIPTISDVIKQQRQEILYLENELDKLNRDSVDTKPEGIFADNVRLCVMKLVSLEVAAEKISPVIQAVSKHLFNVDIPKSDLPNAQTAINIADEGHYIMKREIANALNDGNWGLNKDGTTRKKVKIMDTAVTTSTGKVMSLGFQKMAHETSDAVAEVCQQNLTELSEIAAHSGKISKETFFTSLLALWSFVMNDRAATEKATNNKLIEWRDKMLEGSDMPAETVHTFYCSLHVLLGFHRNTVKRLDDQQKTFRDNNIKLGRDALGEFFIWSRTQAVERVVRTTADIFGPVGDYIGLRDRWEAANKTLGRKSYIGSYKDNRFNGLFEVSAQIIYHRNDFLSLIDEVELMLKSKKQNINKKIRSVRADLRCPILTTLMQVMGLFYLHVTRPFWELSNSQTVRYLELYEYIQPLYVNLTKLTKEPSTLLSAGSEFPMIPKFPPKVGDFMMALSVVIHPDQKDTMTETIIATAEAFIKTMDDQLGDFLIGGKYSQPADEDQLKRTSFSHLTNIACEHHFGTLDSSQKRRPNASFHHHSTVELLKKNFCNI